MTAAYNLSEYLPASPPQVDFLLRLEELSQQSTMLTEKMERQSKELSDNADTAVGRLDDLVQRIANDASKDELSDLTPVLEALEALEDEWAATYLPQMGRFMGNAFECRTLQRDLSRLKATKQLAQAAKVGSILVKNVGHMATMLEALRDSRIRVALIWGKYAEKHEGEEPMFSNPDDLAVYFKTIPNA